jgi:hypothetical protein
LPATEVSFVVLLWSVMRPGNWYPCQFMAPAEHATVTPGLSVAEPAMPAPLVRHGVVVEPLRPYWNCSRGCAYCALPSASVTIS